LQNILRPEHIRTIVDTYINRKVTPKYSHRASLASIRANDYNLNIPRYVDTFEAEASIDLAAITAQLAALAEQEQATDKTIAVFCAELGIAPPFAVAAQERDA
jgi:type I restriction enzyme M protein